MIDFLRIDSQNICCKIDQNIFNKNIQTKVFYWLSTDYCIYWSEKDNVSEITIQKKNGKINKFEYDSLLIKINQDLIDFKTRDIVLNETKNVRDILLIKAFANNDDFEDFNLIENNNKN